MRKLRQTSIAGIIEALESAQIAASTNVDTTTLLLNPDNLTVGTIAEAGRLSNEYADSVITGIDLSQVETNRTAITTINSDLQLDGSIDNLVAIATGDAATRSGVNVDVLATITQSNTDRLVVLNGDVQIEGSVAKAIADIVTDAPESLDTLEEIALKLAADDDDNATIITSISDSKLALQELLNRATDELFIGKNDIVVQLDEVNTGAMIQVALDAFATVTNGRYFQQMALLGDDPEMLDEVTAPQLWANINAINSNDMYGTYDETKMTFELVSLTVENGTITLPATITVADVDSIVINYADNEFDELEVVADVDVPGSFKVYDVANGDLDGQTVVVKYSGYVAPANQG